MDTMVLLMTSVVLVAVVGNEVRSSRTDRRLERIERKLDLVLEHLGLRLEVPRVDEVQGLVREGKRIEAIKVYREATGAGLKEAKEAVDRLG
ncbi:ribosomal protein L7/L12 [Streptomyces tropicalis]|uniref:Ribosomal protein L7/L12 n=1 Tax=Streptomyces tropicalis TaxID=3034234 RepID=A0ABT6AGL7_9ACTN|nr:ribosomal protein L7/L12 [Streptomyces tropicalis]MDF3302990.1 ribosomal protein L7/L12 [Streptomyces tropicalis]